MRTQTNHRVLDGGRPDMYGKTTDSYRAGVSCTRIEFWGVYFRHKLVDLKMKMLILLDTHLADMEVISRTNDIDLNISLMRIVRWM
jgi:hypothetical protein